MGTILTIFNLSGNLPFCKDLLNLWVKGNAISEIMSLMILRVLSSLPLLQLDFSICTMFIIYPWSAFVTNILLGNDQTTKIWNIARYTGYFLAKFGPTLTKTILHLSAITLASVTTLLSILISWTTSFLEEGDLIEDFTTCQVFLMFPLGNSNWLV